MVLIVLWNGESARSSYDPNPCQAAMRSRNRSFRGFLSCNGCGIFGECRCGRVLHMRHAGIPAHSHSLGYRAYARPVHRCSGLVEEGQSGCVRAGMAGAYSFKRPCRLGLARAGRVRSGIHGLGNRHRKAAEGDGGCRQRPMRRQRRRAPAPPGRGRA